MGDTYLHYGHQGRNARTSLNSNAQIAQAVDYTYRGKAPSSSSSSPALPANWSTSWLPGV